MGGVVEWEVGEEKTKEAKKKVRSRRMRKMTRKKTMRGRERIRREKCWKRGGTGGELQNKRRGRKKERN